MKSKSKKAFEGETVDLNPGDMIEISRKGYQHWAVYVGSGYVVHLASSKAGAASLKSVLAEKAEIKKELLSDVAGTDHYCVSNKHDSEWTAQSPEEIVSKAEKLLGQRVKYKLLSKNCEHLANYLRYNVAQSEQVQNKTFIFISSVLSRVMHSSLLIGVWFLLQDLVNQGKSLGDLIEIKRKDFQHWAVYVGFGYVVHLVSECVLSGDPVSKVKMELLSDVAGNDPYSVNNQHDFIYTVRKTYAIIYRAMKLVAKKRVDYEFTSQNCELFANSLRYETA